MKQIETFGNEQNEEKDSVKMSEKTKNILIFYGQLLWCGILLCGVLYVTILLYGLGFIMFWNSFGKSTYKWMDNIWERYNQYVNYVFLARQVHTENQTNHTCMRGHSVCFLHILWSGLLLWLWADYVLELFR